MSVPAAYLAVVAIWTTTPLAIKWSGEGVGFLFGVTARMSVGLAICLLAMALWRLPLPWHRQARRAYLAAGMGIFGAMTVTYWGAQFLPSGWISVIFGLTPIVTGLAAAVWLGERAFTPLKSLGMVLGFGGLPVIFAGQGVGEDALLGGGAILCATLIHSTSSVWVKRLGAGVPALAQTGGGLLVATPLFLFTYALFGDGVPAVMPERSVAAILYLGSVGSVLGFVMYFYVLARVEASRVALITLITPVLALLLGSALNGEVISERVWTGSVMILFGLALYTFDSRRQPVECASEA